jgi:exodeoxyribonuclease VII large subunit
MAGPRLTVLALTQQIDRLLTRAFPAVSVEGELVQLQVPGSGHAYLTLQDLETVLTCIVWRNDWRQHTTLPKVGERVVAHGRLGVYAQHGKYQLYATRVERAGDGVRERKLAEIRERLRAEGLLDPRRRRPLPRFPRVVGVVTSLAGAALQDFLRVSGERWPFARILVSACTVQGQEAPSSVVRALELLYQDGRADVIVVTRGGGSKLDLVAFDDEQVARWIATSPVPIVSAVGHEVDAPLSDEVADAAAPTPSAAAVLVLPDGLALAQRIDEAELALTTGIGRHLEQRRRRLADLTRRLRHPAARVEAAKVRRAELVARLNQAVSHRLDAQRARLRALSAKLEALSPYGVLARGYAIVRAGEAVVKDPAQVAAGDALGVQLAGGELKVVVQ